MADRATIDATLERYYRAWTERDHELYRSVWAADASFADPPTDGEVPPTGFDEILAGMEQVWSRAEAIVYERHHSWHCGHSVAVHSTVRMTLPGAVALVPLVHVFRFDGAGLVRRLEAFLDFELVEMESGDRPDWFG
ncbi:MAG: nuclear transport factor 2 family protein [Acidimicrobiia bacterium]|nr:nuclear transport factor 2 family protein [Acidimicrobiia bacterium]